MAEIAVFTHSYPYCSAMEEFIDLEIPYLAREFDSVRVVPLSPRDVSPLPLPRNAHADLSLADFLASGSSPLKAFFAIRHSPRFRFVFTDAWRKGSRRRLDWLRRVVGVHLRMSLIQQWASDSDVPDIVYTYWLEPWSIGLSRSWPNTPLVSRAHGYDVYSERNVHGEFVAQQATIEVLEQIYCVSEHGCQYLREKYPEFRDRIQVRRLGIEQIAMNSQDFPRDALKLLTISEVRPVKNVLEILEAMKLVSDQGIHVEWTHFGAGEDYDLLVDAARAARNEFLDIRLPGQIANSAVHAYICNYPISLFANVSFSEGVPVSLMEAQFAGIPICATNVGGNAEVLTELDVLLDAPPGIAAALADCAVQVFRSPINHEERVVKHDFAMKEYLAERNYSKFSRELRQFLRL